MPTKKAGKRTESISFRPSPDTRELIENSAQAAGQSLSSEVDQRLREAYWDGERRLEALETIFGGSKNLALGFLVSRIATGLENQRQLTWAEDDDALEQLVCAIVDLLHHLEHGRLSSELLALVGMRLEPGTRALVRGAVSPNTLRDGVWWPVGQGERSTQGERLEVRRSMHSLLQERIVVMVRELLLKPNMGHKLSTDV